MSFFLSLSYSSFRLVPIWTTEVCRVYLFAWASKTWMWRCPVSLLPWETRRVPAAYVDGASLLSQDFIDFLCKARNISLFSPLFSPPHYSLLFFPPSFIPFLLHPPTSSILRISLDSAEAGPRQWTLYKFSATSFLTLPGMFFPMGKWPITVTNWIVSPQIHRWKPCAPVGLYLETEPLRR